MKHFKSILALLLLAVSFQLTAQTYLEEPAHKRNAGPYVTTKAHFIGKYMRSYTYCYDKEKHVALWVAYPLNTVLIGEGSRTDEWAPDPSLSEIYQPVLYRGFKYGSGFDRGHQIPSADRLDPEANKQTFVFTNATPQLHDFNGGIWAELEKAVRSWAKRSDTLYVVTGVIPGNDWIDDNAGNPVNIPCGYYKAVLRKNTDRNGFVHWSANAILLSHKPEPVSTWQKNLAFLKKKSLSLENLEAYTGEVFFPLLKDIIGEARYKKLKASEPASEDWWWK